MRLPESCIEIPPCWRIVPPGELADPGGANIVLGPGPGFGNGEHETTELCLQAIAALAPRQARTWQMLDFGSGSGVLAIAAAKLGAWVDAIDIDPRALEHTASNADLNSVAGRIRCSPALACASGPFDMIVANILRSVLLEFARELVARLAPGGTLVLSGLVSTDVPEVIARYAAVLPNQRPHIHERGDWRALVWRTVRDR
jgi:ribosomal protein L11 methyltransferase